MKKTIDFNTLEQCKTWLMECLRKGNGATVELKELRVESRKMGFKRGVVKQARIELNLKTHHQYDEYGRDTGNFFWYL